MEQIAAWISDLDSFLWGPPLLILLLGCHVFLTFYLKFIQRYVFLGIKLSISNDSHAEGDISQFGALAIALAATIGTGNISSASGRPSSAAAPARSSGAGSAASSASPPNTRKACLRSNTASWTGTA